MLLHLFIFFINFLLGIKKRRELGGKKSKFKNKNKLKEVKLKGLKK